MGNREDLLAGARKAVLERGLAKTTARDIASAAGVSLAAIGYHFGSKERLITEMLTETMGSGVGDEVDAAIRDATTASAAIDALAEVVRRNREVLLLGLENGVRVARELESQAYMAEAVNSAQRDLTETVRAARPELTEGEAEATAKLYFTLLQGLSLLSLIAPTADLLDGNDVSAAVSGLGSGHVAGTPRAGLDRG